MLIRLSINIDDISTERLVAGKKGRYLNAICFVKDAPDQYGNNGFISESVSLDEKNAGKRGKIIGNIKVMTKNTSTAETGDGLPF